MAKKIVLLLLFFFLLFPISAQALYMASDKVYLYKNGKRFTDNEIYYLRDEYLHLCEDGICIMQQQTGPVSFLFSGKMLVDPVYYWKRVKYSLDVEKNIEIIGSSSLDSPKITRPLLGSNNRVGTPRVYHFEINTGDLVEKKIYFYGQIIKDNIEISFLTSVIFLLIIFSLVKKKNTRKTKKSSTS
jgi:hypothetical protein